MVDNLERSDTFEDYYNKTDDLINYTNNISSFSSIQTDTNSFTLDPGVINDTISIRGGSNISTNFVTDKVEVSVVNNPVFGGISSSGIVSLTGSTTITNLSSTNASVENLTVGTTPDNYTLSTTQGTAGQVLVFDGVGGMYPGLGGTGAENFTDLDDVFSDYIGRGALVPFIDGSEGGNGSGIITDNTFIYDTTNKFLKVSQLRIGEGINPLDDTPINIRKTYNSSQPTGILKIQSTIGNQSLFSTNICDTIVSSLSPNTNLTGSRILMTQSDQVSATFRGQFIDMNSNDAAVVNSYGIDIDMDNVNGSGILMRGVSIDMNCNIGNVDNRSGVHINLSDPNTGVTDWGVYSNAPIHCEMELSQDETSNYRTPDPGQVKQFYNNGRLYLASNDGGTIRYKYLDLMGTGVTWVHTLTAP